MPVGAKKTQTRTEEHSHQRATDPIENQCRDQQPNDEDHAVFVARANARKDEPHCHHCEDQADCCEKTPRCFFLTLRRTAHHFGTAAEAYRRLRSDGGFAVRTYQIVHAERLPFFGRKWQSKTERDAKIPLIQPSR